MLKKFNHNVILTVPGQREFNIVSSDVLDLATCELEYFLPNNHFTVGSLWVKENFSKIVRTVISADLANLLKPYRVK